MTIDIEHELDVAERWALGPEQYAAKQEIDRRAVVAVLGDELLGQTVVLGLLREALDRYVETAHESARSLTAASLLEVLERDGRTGFRLELIPHVYLRGQSMLQFPLTDACVVVAPPGALERFYQAPQAALDIFARLLQSRGAGRTTPDYVKALEVLDRIEFGINRVRTTG